jgi:hypothetical protein
MVASQVVLAATSDKRALGPGPLHNITKKVNDGTDTTARRITPEASLLVGPPNPGPRE